MNWHGKKVQDDLEAFLSSTDHLATHAAGSAGENDEEDEEYESDGGTKYIRDLRTGTWIHEALAPKRDKKKEMQPIGSSALAAPTASSSLAAINKKRKKDKAKFAAKDARNWIYVTGLPRNTNEEEVAVYSRRWG